MISVISFANLQISMHANWKLETVNCKLVRSGVASKSAFQVTLAFIRMSNNKFDRMGPNSDEILETRTNMAIVHFALTAPKYSFSLFLFLAARCIPLSTPYEEIHKPIKELHKLVELESNSYLQCTETSFERAINSKLKIQTQDEYSRVEEAQQANKETIEAAQQISRLCFDTVTNARSSILEWWSLNGQETTVDSCSEEDETFLESFFGGDNSSAIIREEISSLVQDYIQTSSIGLERIHGYAVARFQYDFEYFVTERIHPAIQLLEEKRISLMNESFTFMIDKVQVEHRLRESLHEMELVLDSAKGQLDLLTALLEDYKVTITGFYSAYQDVYQRLMDGARFVGDFLPSGTELPDMFDLTPVPVADSLLPLHFNFPNNDILESTQEVIERTSKGCLDLLEDIYGEMERQGTHRLRSGASELANTLSLILRFDDYDPPKFIGSQEGIQNLSDEINHLESLGQVTKSNSKTALDHLKPPIDKDFLEDDIDLDLPAGDSNPPLSSFTKNAQTRTFQYLQPIFPTISIPEILLSTFSWILSNAWILEVIIQAFRLWGLEAKYSKGAIPDLPIIDYVEDFTDDKDSSKDESKPMFLLLKVIISTCASPGYLMILTLIPLCFGAMVMWRPHVQSNCRATMQGTFLANQFLAPILINQANVLGNVHYLKGETECHQLQQSLCNEMRIQVDASYQSDISTLHALHMYHSKAVKGIQAMKSCIDIDANKNQMNEACCGLKGFPRTECKLTNLTCPVTVDITAEAVAFRPLEEYLKEEACLQESIPRALKDAQFDCTPLADPCTNIPCDGVNEEYIWSRTVQVDCKVELYILDCCTFLLMVVYQIFAVNMICTMLFQGIRQVFWRKLCPTGIRFHTHLHENGDLAKGQDREDRFKLVSTAIQRFELVGKIKLIIGIVGFAFWAVTLVIFRELDLF